MCGFVGYFSRAKGHLFSSDLIPACETLSHRGPDGSGEYQDHQNGIGLGHRRLSIIDLSDAGRQPMTSSDGRQVIVYNGEIYNFRDLRNQLIQRGYSFQSQTDTEVLLNAYLEWGTECLQHFIGMFALAIWDTEQKRLFLARDRMGIKPLYYYLHDDSLIFASELKALMAFRAFPKSIDDDALSLFLHYQYIPAPRTVFMHTFKLTPGCFLLVDASGSQVRSYWNLHQKNRGHIPLTEGNESALLAELDQRLTLAVADHLVADVPLGVLLSGGIDSTLVAALMRKVHTGPVRTFTIGFGDPNYNEAHWADKIAQHLGTDHSELYIDPKQVLEVVPSLPNIYDEPFADSSAIATHLISKLTRSKVTVALAGDGGDEQFSGYVRYWMTRNMTDGFNQIPLKYRVMLANILNLIPTSWVEKCYLPVRDLLPKKFRIANVQDKWAKFLLQMKEDELCELYRATIAIFSISELEALIGMRTPISQFEQSFRATSHMPVLSRLMYADQRTYLPDGMLTKVDRASMAVGLEVRVPLLDHRVVEYSAILPESLKYRNGISKYALRKILAKYVPLEFFERPKMGFAVPLAQWLRGELKEVLLDYLSPENLKREGRFNHRLIMQYIHMHLNGTANHHHKLWALLIWQLWRERWANS